MGFGRERGHPHSPVGSPCRPGTQVFPAAEDPGSTRLRERSDAHLVRPVRAPRAPAYYPFGFVGPVVALLCGGAPSFPGRAPQDGKGSHLEAVPPPPSAPIHSLGSSLPGGFLTPLAILSWCLMIPGLRSGARPPQGSDADRSHVARRARDSAGAPRVALWGGGLARWGAPGKAGAGRARRRRGQGRRGRRRAARGEPARRLGLPRPGPPTRSSGAGAGADSGRPPLFAFLWQAAGLGLKGIASIWNVVYFS